MTPCREPGCPFPARVGASLCTWCLGESLCAVGPCKNTAQRGPLCRVHAHEDHPGEVYYRRRWYPIREWIVHMMRGRTLAGCKWTREGDHIVGRDGSFEIRLKTRLWEPTK